MILEFGPFIAYKISAVGVGPDLVVSDFDPDVSSADEWTVKTKKLTDLSAFYSLNNGDSITLMKSPRDVEKSFLRITVSGITYTHTLNLPFSNFDSETIKSNLRDYYLCQLFSHTLNFEFAKLCDSESTLVIHSGFKPFSTDVTQSKGGFYVNFFPDSSVERINACVHFCPFATGDAPTSFALEDISDINSLLPHLLEYIFDSTPTLNLNKPFNIYSTETLKEEPWVTVNHLSDNSTSSVQVSFSGDTPTKFLGTLQEVVADLSGSGITSWEHLFFTTIQSQYGIQVCKSDSTFSAIVNGRTFEDIRSCYDLMLIVLMEFPESTPEVLDEFAIHFFQSLVSSCHLISESIPDDKSVPKAVRKLKSKLKIYSQTGHNKASLPAFKGDVRQRFGKDLWLGDKSGDPYATFVKPFLQYLMTLNTKRADSNPSLKPARSSEYDLSKITNHPIFLRSHPARVLIFSTLMTGQSDSM